MITNRWNDTHFSGAKTSLQQRVYTSRLLGQDPSLVLWGGGNTSLKDETFSLFGKKEKILYIKGSGHDLASISEEGFSSLWLKPLADLSGLDSLSDEQMLDFFRIQSVHSPSTQPSVETLLHAFLPHRFIDHTHAEPILALTNQPDGATWIHKVFSERVAIVPYIMPGFKLAKLAKNIFNMNPAVEGLVLLKHGLITFGDSAKESYEKMIQLVQEAENFIQARRKQSSFPTTQVSPNQYSWMLEIRKNFLKRNFPCSLVLNNSEIALSFVNHPHIQKLSLRGPLTPDHTTKTKRLPLFLGTECLESDGTPALSSAFTLYEQSYKEYFLRNQPRLKQQLNMLDPLPRVILVPSVGIITAGKCFSEAMHLSAIYEHTVSTILMAESIGTYESLPEEDIFDVEYWAPQQDKLKLSLPVGPLSGKTAIVTGGANGIGLGITKELLKQGANVFMLDIDERKFATLEKELDQYQKLGNRAFILRTDVTNRNNVSDSFFQVVKTVGGFDILVINAGIFPSSCPIESTSQETWDKSLSINLNGAFHCISEGLRWLKKQEMGGDIVIIASKNVPAPGKNASAYSVSKAAQTQLGRVCALEGAEHGIRVNMLHPHLILDTNIWNEEVIQKRAQAYSMTKEQYMTNNLLKTRLFSEDVAKAVFALVGGYFSKTTGAQIPIDGGSDRTL